MSKITENARSGGSVKGRRAICLKLGQECAPPARAQKVYGHHHLCQQLVGRLKPATTSAKPRTQMTDARLQKAQPLLPQMQLLFRHELQKAFRSRGLQNVT